MFQLPLLTTVNSALFCFDASHTYIGSAYSERPQPVTGASKGRDYEQRAGHNQSGIPRDHAVVVAILSTLAESNVQWSGTWSVVPLLNSVFCYELILSSSRRSRQHSVLHSARTACSAHAAAGTRHAPRK